MTKQKCYKCNTKLVKDTPKWHKLFYCRACKVKLGPRGMLLQEVLEKATEEELNQPNPYIAMMPE